MFTQTTTNQNEAVRLTLPRGVLVALLDNTHRLADVTGARALGLLSAEGTLTTIGELVCQGIADTTDIRHRMLQADKIADTAARALRGE